MPIDPKAFVSEQPTVARPAMNQALLTPSNVQPQLLTTDRPSADTVGSANDSLAMAQNMVKQGGFAALGGGLASLFLAPKAAELQKQLNETQVRAENLKLEKGMFENKQLQNNIKIQERQLETEAGMDALSRIESGASENIMQDIKLAKGELNENGTPKTNLQKFAELQRGGQFKEINLEKVAKFAPGLILRLNQKHSLLTSDNLMKELDDAAKQQRQYEESLLHLQGVKMKIAADSGGDSDAEKKQRENFKAYGNVLGSMGKIMEQIKNSDLSIINPGAIEEIYKDVVMPGLKAAQDFGLKSGVIKPGQKTLANPKDGASAVTDFITKGDPSGISAVQDDLNGLIEATGSAAQKPVNSADRTKDKKKPLPIGTPTAKGKKEVDPRLQSLGVSID